MIHAERAFEDFASVIHEHCPALHSIDLHTAEIRVRGLCGEHGRMVPTRQGLCPICGGYVEILDEAQVAARRRLWAELQAM